MRDDEQCAWSTEIKIELDLFCAGCGSKTNGKIVGMYSLKALRVDIEVCAVCTDHAISERLENDSR